MGFCFGGGGGFHNPSSLKRFWLRAILSSRMAMYGLMASSLSLLVKLAIVSSGDVDASVVLGVGPWLGMSETHTDGDVS